MRAEQVEKKYQIKNYVIKYLRVHILMTLFFLLYMTKSYKHTQSLYMRTIMQDRVTFRLKYNGKYTIVQSFISSHSLCSCFCE